MKRAATILFVLAMLLTACGDRAPAADSSGVSGVVVSGPQCPVETLQSPCPDLPVADIVVRVTAADGSLAAEPMTDAAGRFEVTLDPGDYVLQPEVEGGGASSAKPAQVTVVEGSFVEVTLLVDTGIR
jgi:hypothetical protein